MVSECSGVVIYDKEPKSAVTTVEHYVESHYCSLAAELSRVNDGKVIYLDELR